MYCRHLKYADNTCTTRSDDPKWGTLHTEAYETPTTPNGDCYDGGDGVYISNLHVDISGRTYRFVGRSHAMPGCLDTGTPFSDDADGECNINPPGSDSWRHWCSATRPEGSTVVSPEDESICDLTPEFEGSLTFDLEWLDNPAMESTERLVHWGAVHAQHRGVCQL